MQIINQSVLDFFANSRTEWLTFLMFIITYSGSYLLISGLTFLSAISFYIHKHTARIFPLLVSVGGSGVTVFLLKNIFYEARPAGALYLETDSAFPSGHAAMVLALYGFFLYTIWKHDRHALKKFFVAFLFVLIVLVGISRLYLGVHYLSDILAGYSIGLVWLFLSVKLHKYLLRHFSALSPH